MALTTYGEGRYGVHTYVSQPALANPTVSFITDWDTESATLSWTEVLSLPAGARNEHLIWRDGVVVATVPAGTTTYTDVVPGGGYHTYVVQARDSDGDVSDVSASVLVRIPSLSDPWGPPSAVVIVGGEEIDCSKVVADIQIRHNTENFTTVPSPSSARLTFLNPLPEMYEYVAVGKEVQVVIKGQSASKDIVRFFGRITDADVTWESAGNLAVMSIVAVGPIEHLAWQRIVAAWAAETDVVRMTRLLETTYGGQGWTIDPGTEDLRAVDYSGDNSVSGQSAAELICRSTQSRLVEMPDGQLFWQDRLHRESSLFHELDVCHVGIDSHWLAASEEMVNSCTVTYGTGAEGQPQPTTTHSVSVALPWERRSVTITTDLALQVDAAAYAKRVVDARTPRSWTLPALFMRLDLTAYGVAAPLLRTVRTGDRVWLYGWPVTAPAQEMYGHIEGWTERITNTTWEWRAHLSAMAITGAVNSWPLNLKATAVSTSQIDLDWDDHPRAATYEVWSGGVKLTTVNAPTTAYSHSGLAMGSTHCYKIVSRRAPEETQTIGAIIETSKEVCAKTIAVGSADPVTITYCDAHMGRVRVGVTRPADVDWGSATIVAKQGAWPANVSDGVTLNITGSGTFDLGGPGVVDRGDQTWYVRIWSKNTIGEWNSAQVPAASAFFLRSPVEFRPSWRNAYGASYGWENQNRVRCGNTSANTYRAVWIYGDPGATLAGRKATGCHVLVSRKDGGPGGAMAVPIGTHTYTSAPGGQPTVSNTGGRGSIARMSTAWIDVSDWAQAFSNGSIKGFGLGGSDTTNVNTTYVGQPIADCGVVHFRHSDKA